ncbi:MAG: hypothetical protein B7X78_01420, partial [Sphingomonadales bacterium 39-62-4]
MSELTLTAPDPVAAIPAEQAAGLVPVSNEVRSQLHGKVDAYALHLQQQRALGRQTLSQSDLRMWTSPWGRPDHGSKYAIG